MDEVNKVIKIVLERGSTDLAGYLKKNPDEITVDFIKMCWRKMLDAVDVIHKEGIIHSDLKPANFLLVEWNLKLIDFGIANAIQVCFHCYSKSHGKWPLEWATSGKFRDMVMYFLACWQV